MPTYEYACRDCGEHIEVVQSFRDDALEVCPGCDGELRKVFSPAGIIFKGSGFHSTDYGSSSRTAESPPGDSKEGDGEGSQRPATESAPSEQRGEKSA